MTGFGRRARTAAIALLAAATLTLTACSGADSGADDAALNTVDPGFATAVDDAMAAAMQWSGSSNAIVGVWSATGGEYARAFGDGASAASAIRGAQATQPVMCALLLDLAADGTVPLDREVIEDVPRQVGIEGITYADLCTAKTGLADFKVGLTAIFANNPTRPWSDRELFAQGLARSPLSWPGLNIHVSDTDALLLARALPLATGQALSELLADRVFGPANMASTFYPTDLATQTSLPAGGMTGKTYPISGGQLVCEALTDTPQVSPSMLSGAGATVTTITDLKRFYESYLGGSFGGDLAGLITETVPVANPERNEAGEPLPAEGEPDPNAPQRGFGIERIGPLYGMSGSMTGTSTAAYHDPATGFTVVVSLNNSSTGAGFAKTLALQLAALAAEAGVGPEVGWASADRSAALAAAAICQPPAEEPPAEEPPVEG